MFITKKSFTSQYTRRSKNGVEHSYSRVKTVALFLCDCCGQEFSRDVRKMDRKRLNNNFFHCCPNCDAKRFAQRKGVEQKKIWDMPASTTLPVAKF